MLYFGIKGVSQDFLEEHFSGITNLDTSGIDEIYNSVINMSYIESDAQAIIDGQSFGFKDIVNMVEKGAEGFADFLTDVISGTVGELQTQAPNLIAQIVAGIIAGGDIEDIAEAIAVQAVSAGAVEAILNSVGAITKDQFGNITINNDFGLLLNDNALATEAIKGAIINVAVTAILHGSDAGLEDYATAAATASVGRVINYGITNSGYNLLTQQTSEILVNGVPTPVYTPTPAGAGLIAAATVITSSLINGQGINEDTLRSAATTAGTATLASALVGTSTSAGLLGVQFGAFAGPAGIIIGAALGVIIGNLFKSGGEKVYHNETLGFVVQKINGVNTIIAVREAGGLLKTTDANGNIVGADIIGNDGHEVLVGDNQQNIIVANGGDDMLEGRGQQDVLLAGTGDVHVEAGNGDDYIEGNEGNDKIHGDDGNDMIMGGSGHDIISGGKGDDQIEGEEGNDLIYGDSGNDVILGGNGNDVIDAGAGNDVINGDDGDDVIDGSIGNDEIHGGYGDDVIYAGAGNDSVYGAGGNDVLHGGLGNDTLHGGLGNDSFNFTAIAESKNGAFDTILDFTIGQDKINLSGLASFGIDTFADLIITQSATETTIKAYDTAHPTATDYFEVHLTGVLTLQNSDFIWV